MVNGVEIFVSWLYYSFFC